jgi:hypothetical protein
MKRMNVILPAAIASLALAASANASTIVGNTGQGSQQGINSSQNASQSTGGGTTVITGENDPTLAQASGNANVNSQQNGDSDSSGGSVIVGNTTQGSQQGINSSQNASQSTGGGSGPTVVTGENDPGVFQGSGNLNLNGQLNGDSGLLGNGGGGGSVIVGNTTQNNQQGINSSQNASQGTGGSGGPTVVVDENDPFLLQLSGNANLNGELNGGGDLILI